MPPYPAFYVGADERTQGLMLAWQTLNHTNPSISIRFPKSGEVKVIRLLDRIYLNSEITDPFDVA